MYHCVKFEIVCYSEEECMCKLADFLNEELPKSDTIVTAENRFSVLSNVPDYRPNVQLVSLLMVKSED